MRTINTLLLMFCTVGMLSWSNLEAQVAPAEKKTSTKATKSKSPVLLPGDLYPLPTQGSDKVAPQNVESKKKTKGSTQNFSDGSVRFKSSTDGTSNTSKSPTNVAVKKKKKSKPTFGGISDGTSNTIAVGERSSSKKSQRPSKTKSQPVNPVNKKD